MDTDFEEEVATLSEVITPEGYKVLSLHTKHGNYGAGEVVDAQRAHAALNAYYLLSAEDKKRVDKWAEENYG